MKIKNIFVTTVSLISMYTFAYALPVTDSTAVNSGVVSRFTSYAELGTFDIKTPKVVEINLPQGIDTYKRVLVTSSGTEVFEPSLIKKSQTAAELIPSIINATTQETLSALTDRNYQTFKQFDLPEVGNGTIALNFSYQTPITTTSFTFALDANVALPRTITIYKEDGGKEEIVLATVQPNQTTVLFPRTTASSWKVVFTYAQPLRITETYFSQELKANEQTSLRFLALPGTVYRLYVNPDQEPSISFKKEAGDLYSDQGVLKSKLNLTLIMNPIFKDIDSDADGVKDVRDNCVSVKNEDQKDIDSNGRGDACDDYDRDGIINSLDNCINNPNRDQLDTDHDGTGDACDANESRFLEANSWVPWVALSLVGLVIIGLMTNMVIGGLKKRD